MIENYSEDMPEDMKVSPELKLLQGKLAAVQHEIKAINDAMVWAMCLQDMLENRIALEQEIVNEWIQSQKTKQPKS